MQLTKASDRVNAMLGEKRDDQSVITKTRFAIPKNDVDPPWFMAEFTRKTSPHWTQLIFQKTPQGWRVVAESMTEPKVRLPAIAKDRNGLATALAVDERGAFTVSPQQAAQAHARLLASVGEDTHARQLFSAGFYTTAIVDAQRRERQAVQGQWDLRYQRQPTQEVFALSTSAGGALIWYGLREQDNLVAHPGADKLQMSDPVRAALSHGNFFASKVIGKSMATYVAVVPPSPGKIRVMGEWFSNLSVTGS